MLNVMVAENNTNDQYATLVSLEKGRFSHLHRVCTKLTSFHFCFLTHQPSFPTHPH
jgi:hypothetical protein